MIDFANFRDGQHGFTWRVTAIDRSNAKSREAAGRPRQKPKAEIQANNREAPLTAQRVPLYKSAARRPGKPKAFVRPAIDPVRRAPARHSTWPSTRSRWPRRNRAEWPIS
jgi:hypothetical protein